MSTNLLIASIFFLGFIGAISAGSPIPPVTPFIDITMDNPSLSEVAEATGHYDYSAAFVLASSQGCDPKWGGAIALDDNRIIGEIRKVQEKGGRIFVATGGAISPYLENACTSVDSLLAAYEKILDVVKTDYLDIDVEAAIDFDRVNKALVQLKRRRPNTVVRYTLMVQGDDYGVAATLGYDLLKNAATNGLDVDIVNPMTMEFWSRKSDWVQAVIDASISTVNQMKEIWPKLSTSKLRAKLGITPMIGRNFNSRIFGTQDAKKLVKWSQIYGAGQLSFWSVGRDNGNCSGGSVSPECSSITQSKYEFTKIFSQYKGPVGDNAIDDNVPNDNGDSGNHGNNGTVVDMKNCRAKSETRFNDWCKSNCAVGHCPADVCICT